MRQLAFNDISAKSYQIWTGSALAESPYTLQWADPFLCTVWHTLCRQPTVLCTVVFIASLILFVCFCFIFGKCKSRSLSLPVPSTSFCSTFHCQFYSCRNSSTIVIVIISHSFSINMTIPDHLLFEQELRSCWDGRSFGHNKHGPKSGGCCAAFRGRSWVPI